MKYSANKVVDSKIRIGQKVKPKNSFTGTFGLHQAWKILMFWALSVGCEPDYNYNLFVLQAKKPNISQF